MTPSVSFALKSSVTWAAAMVLASLVAGQSSAATVVFDNLDPTPSPFPYANFGTWYGNFLPNLYGDASTSFTPSVSGALDQLDLGMVIGHLNGTTAFSVALRADNAGTPGATLWSTNATMPLGPFGQVVTLPGLAGPTLAAGTPYWITASTPVDGITMHQWYANNQGDVGLAQGPQHTAPFTGDRYALRVCVKIPEPAGAGLAAIAAAVVALARRRRLTPGEV